MYVLFVMIIHIFCAILNKYNIQDKYAEVDTKKACSKADYKIETSEPSVKNIKYNKVDVNNTSSGEIRI